MASVNKVILVGNLGRDPEVKQVNGQSVANFSIATSEKYKNKAGEQIEETEWHNIVIWGKLVEIVEQYVTKGSTVYLEGKLKTRKWEKDGVTKYATDIVADKMQMLGGKGEKKESSQQAPADDSAFDDTDTIPF